MNDEQTSQQPQPLDKPPEPDPNLFNPYPASVFKHGQSNTIRLSYDVAKRDVQTTRVVMLDWGCMSDAVRVFIRHIYEYCKLNNLDLDSRQQLIDHIRAICPIGAVPYDPAVSTRQPNGEGPDRDDRRGTGSLHSTDPSTSNKSATKPGKRTSKAGHQQGQDSK